MVGLRCTELTGLGAKHLGHPVEGTAFLEPGDLCVVHGVVEEYLICGAV